MGLNTVIKGAIQALMRVLGYEIRRCGLSSFHTPDDEFLRTYRVIRPNTLVDVNRCYDLWSLVGESAKLAGCLIEVGVWRGGTGALIAKRARLCGIVEPVYLCDTFAGVVKASSHDPIYRGGEHADASRQTAETLVRTLDLSNAVILQGVFPEETSEHVADREIRFCHVDVDVYQSAKDVVEWIWPRLVVGGIVVFDDYGSPACEGVRVYVNELRDCRDRLVMINSNGHAIVVRIQ